MKYVINANVLVFFRAYTMMYFHRVCPEEDQHSLFETLALIIYFTIVPTGWIRNMRDHNSFYWKPDLKNQEL